jgi:hypothetical protein
MNSGLILITRGPPAFGVEASRRRHNRRPAAWGSTGDICEDDLVSGIVQQQAYELRTQFPVPKSTAFILC